MRVSAIRPLASLRFLGEVGSGTPVTGPGNVPAGHQVVAVDTITGSVQPFFRVKIAALGPPGWELVVTPGPKRPVDVRFSPDGNSLYIADLGALTAFPGGAAPFPRTFPGTGVIWRITPIDMPASGPPAELSPIPPKLTPHQVFPLPEPVTSSPQGPSLLVPGQPARFGRREP